MTRTALSTLFLLASVIEGTPGLLETVEHMPAVAPKKRKSYPNARPSRVYVPVKKATAWEIRNRAQKAALYANTPKHPPTRQQRRYAARRA